MLISRHLKVTEKRSVKNMVLQALLFTTNSNFPNNYLYYFIPPDFGRMSYEFVVSAALIKRANSQICLTMVVSLSKIKVNCNGTLLIFGQSVVLTLDGFIFLLA